MRLSTLIVVMSCLLLQFCGKKDKPETLEMINIESATESFRQTSLSIFSESIEYIQLTNTADFPMRDVNLLDCTDSLLIVSDLQSCFLFSSDGTLIRNFGKKGRGPGEFQYIQNLKFGGNGSIFIQSGIDLLEYSINGIFIRAYPIFAEKDLFSSQPRQWCFVNDSLVLVQIRNDSGVENNKAAILDLNGTLLVTYRNFIHFVRETSGTATTSSIASIYPFCGGIRYKELFNDTLFHLTTSFELNPVYRFYLGKYYASYIDFSSQNRQETDEREWIRVYDLFETDDMILLFLQTNLNYLKRTEPVYESGFLLDKYTVDLVGVYEKRIKETYIVEISRTEEKLLRTGLVNDIDGGPKFFPRFRMGDNKFAMPIQAFELKKYIASESFKNTPAKYPEKKKALEGLANSLSEDDNPVLMVVTMR